VTDQADQPDTRPISPLRQRMLEDMAMHGLRDATQRDYLRFVRSFAAFLGRPPDTATPEDIRRFQVFQAESGVQPPTINCSVSALRFFFTVTLDRPDLSRRLVLVRHPRRLPTVLSAKEVGQLLEAAPGPKYRAALGSPTAWLMTIAHRTAVDRVRASEASRRRDDAHAASQQDVEFDTTAESAQASLEAQRVRRALTTLTDAQRSAVELAYLGGYTHTEVARLLDLPLGTAKTRIRDGLIRLRDTLGVPA